MTMKYKIFMGLLVTAFSWGGGGYAIAGEKSFSKTGVRGGSVNVTTTQKGTNFSGSVGGVSARGGSATADSSATYNPKTGTVSGTTSFDATGATGKTASGTGSVTYDSNSGTYTGDVSGTGVRGQSQSATVTGGNGSTTITGSQGKTKTFTRP